jgi:hypothetical protein
MNSKVFQQQLSLFFRASARFVIPLAILVLTSSPGRAEDQGSDGQGSNSIVGTWVTQATLSIVPPGFPSATFQAVETFNSDGTMHVVAQLPGATIGAGVWKSTGHDRFTYTFTFYRQDPSSTLFLPTQVDENMRMTSTNSYVTTDVIMPLDANGNPLPCPNPPFPNGVCAFPGTVQGTRYQFASFNTVLP